MAFRQFVLVVALVWFEQRSLRWSTLRDALWLRSPQSPKSGRVGGRLWLILIPLIALVLVNANQNFPFGGTAVLIMVGVGLDTVKQIESQLQQRNYEGFLK